MTGPALEIQDLRHDLPDAGPILQIAALQLPGGAMTVLTGPSGSGKTTLLYLLAGLLRPTAGRILWDGTDLAALPDSARDRWRRQGAGFIFQDFHLIPELSPLDNVLVPRWFSAFSARDRRGRARELLAHFGVPERRRTAVLSRGEQQRVALARALLSSPRVLFADEPTASLDAVAGEAVARALLAEAKDEGRSVIVASHDPALIALADRHLALVHGRLEEAGGKAAA